jgi:hypothetical protein
MTRPHIIFIMTDQQRFDTIRALGYDYVDTPNLDRLVNEGVTFTNCHITAPSCAPSRASLFTGHYPHTTGILRNADRWTQSWIKLLQDSGYRTINMGKMHSYPYHTPLGFEERYVVENKDRYLEERFYFDEWDKALRARGLVKQQRELYRKRADYRESLGAFTWDLPADMQSDNFVGDMTSWYIRAKPKDDRPLFYRSVFPGRILRMTPRQSSPRSTCSGSFRCWMLRRKSWTDSPRRSARCGFTIAKSITIPSCICSIPRANNGIDSGPTTWPTSR